MAGVVRVLVVVFLALSACGSDSDDAPRGGPADQPDAVVAYLAGVETAMAEVSLAITSVVERLAASYSERAVLFEAFGDGTIEDAMERAQLAADALDPPAEHASDHDRWRSSLARAEVLAGDLTAAVEQEDLVALGVTVAELQVTGSVVATEVSPRFCAAVRLDVGVEAVPCTERSDPWEAGTARAARRYAATVVPRITLVPPFTPDELAEYLVRVQPAVEEELRELERAQSALDPPGERADDHDALVALYRDLGALASEITVAASRGEHDRFDELFAESGRIFDGTAAALSPDVTRLLSPLFDG